MRRAAEPSTPGSLGLGYAPWHFLYFFPLPHQHGSLRPICSLSVTRRCSTGGSGSSEKPFSSMAPAAAAAMATAPCAAPPPEYVTRPPPVGELAAELTLRGGGVCSKGRPSSPTAVTSTWKIICEKSAQIVFMRSRKSSNASFL